MYAANSIELNEQNNVNKKRKQLYADSYPHTYPWSAEVLFNRKTTVVKRMLKKGLLK